jgi:lipoate-protein ligase B
MQVIDLGLMEYRQAWAKQEEAHQEVLDGAPERILIVEHPPVITLGRRDGGERHLIASADQLNKLGVDVVRTDRGGDVTFHGPGQVVAYPIIRLVDHGLSVGGYVRTLQEAVVKVLDGIGIAAHLEAGAVGVWVNNEQGIAAKICALGVRIRRGVSLHGIALNVRTELGYFDLIVPCGLTGRPVTSVEKILGDRTPEMERIKQRVAGGLIAAFQR